MKNLSFSRLFFIIFFFVSFPSVADTLCKKDEINYFTCTIKSSEKIVSLCGSNYWDLEKHELITDAWLQYRFGKKNNIELVFPKEKKGSLAKFEAEYHHPYHGFMHSIGFKNKDANYSIDVDETETNTFYGVIVERDKKTVELACTGMPTTPGVGSGIDFYTLIGELADQNNDGK
ncbi:MAG TPA: hypothetical protein VIE65_18905 [Methylobacter sp.]|jgi:phosphorylcholine metabolism protein LicD